MNTMMNNPQYPYQPQPDFAPAMPLRRSGHASAIKIALGIAAALIALLLGLLVLLLIGVETGTGCAFDRDGLCDYPGANLCNPGALD